MQSGGCNSKIGDTVRMGVHSICIILLFTKKSDKKGFSAGRLRVCNIGQLDLEKFFADRYKRKEYIC